MKKIKFSFLPLIIIFSVLVTCMLSFSSCDAKQDDKKKLIMATNAEFPPYEYIENGEFMGIDVEIANLLADKLGMTLEIQNVTFDSIIAGVVSGKYDMGMAGMTVNEDRLKNVNFTDTYAKGVQVVIVKKDSGIKSPDDFFNFDEDGNPVSLKEGIKIAVQLGTTGDIYSSSSVEDGGFGEENVIKCRNGAEAVLTLSSGKCDAVVIDNEPAKSYVAKNKDLVILDSPYVEEEYAICVNKENNELLNLLNSALREYKENGTVQSIIDKYINDRSEDSTEEFDNWWDEFKAEFEQNFIEKDRWKYLTDGLLMTIQITFFSLIIGIVIGVIVSALRSTYDKNFVEYRKKGGFKYYILKFFNTICHIYISVIRGTPMVVQLLIMYYVIFASSENAMLIATISFGINSGAYVAEIIRGGIMSIDGGQFEAGRSLGLNYPQTMYYVILPQAIKNVLPSLCNEFIVLIKETSIAGYVGIADLTKGGDIIRGTTFSAFMPLIAVALIYLVIVLVLTKLVGILEKRLRKNERTYE